MRHLKKTKKLHRTEEERKKLWIALSAALIREGKITTFTVRGKWFRPKFERLVTLCKRAGDDSHLAFRHMRQYFGEDVARRMVEVIAPKFKGRNGGYTSQIKLMTEFSNLDKSVIMLTE